jgi:hypothetical protein
MLGLLLLLRQRRKHVGRLSRIAIWLGPHLKLLLRLYRYMGPHVRRRLLHSWLYWSTRRDPRIPLGWIPLRRLLHWPSERTSSVLLGRRLIWRTGPGEAASATDAEGDVGETALPQTDQKKALVMPPVVAEPARMDPWAAAMMVEEGRAQMDPSAAAMMVEDAVAVAEEGPGQTDSRVAEVLGEVSVVAVQEPTWQRTDLLRELVDSADTREHLFAEMVPLQE